MKTLRCSDAAIINIAQDLVDRWTVQRNGTLLEAIGDLERSPWPGMSLTAGQRLALRRMADAIRAGRGHARTNPRPLRAILEACTARELNVA